MPPVLSRLQFIIFLFRMNKAQAKQLHFAFLHGFASGPGTKKGTHLAKTFADKFGLTLHLPNLNYPSFSEISYTNALQVLDNLHQSIVTAENDEQVRWCLIGSSMGGYLASR